MSRRLIVLLTAASFLAAPAMAASAEPVHGIAMHGDLKLPAGFAHFPYVNPNAPKGGRITLGTTGSFDSVNPLIVRGEAVVGIRDFVLESLLTRSQDEPFTLYGLLAETVEVPDDRSSITFNLNPLAKFSDGHGVTADDVIFSMELLRDKGRPNHRTYYRKIATAEKLSERSVRFTFKPVEADVPAAKATSDASPATATYDREMPLIMGLMPVVAKHATKPEDFDKTSLTPLIGSGPYAIAAIDAGRSVTYALNADYWGRELPVNRGRYNFGEVRYDYYREPAAQFEAFKIGGIDLRTEDDPARWAENYDFPAAKDGQIAKSEFTSGLPAGMSALVFNLRRGVFQDQNVRQALIRLFNFEWINRTLFHNLYRRTQSYFERSQLAALSGVEDRPAGDAERALLAPFAGAVRDDIMNGTYRYPISDGTGHNRANARQAFDLLKQAGYSLQDGKLVHPQKGQLQLEILAGSSSQERTLAPFIADVQRLGASARVRVVDSAQYQVRLKDYDFDMIQNFWPASLSPGNEQLFRWSSRVAETPGSYNYAGVKNPAADAMIAALLSAHSREEFTAAVRAFDRVLLSGDYVIPMYHAPSMWVAHWKRLKHNGVQPLFGFNLDSWWIEEDKSASAPQ